MKTWEEGRTPAFLLAKGRPVAAFLFPPLQLGGRPRCFLKQDLQSTLAPGGPAAHHGLVGGTGQDDPLRQGVRDVGGAGEGARRWLSPHLGGPHNSAPATQQPRESGLGWGPWVPLEGW